MQPHALCARSKTPRGHPPSSMPYLRKANGTMIRQRNPSRHVPYPIRVPPARRESMQPLDTLVKYESQPGANETQPQADESQPQANAPRRCLLSDKRSSSRARNPSSSGGSVPFKLRNLCRAFMRKSEPCALE